MEKVQRFLKGNLQEFPNRSAPKFASRLLAVVPHLPIELSLLNGSCLRVPSWAISEEQLHRKGAELCDNLKAWGFNGLLIGLTKQPDSPLKKTNGNLKTLAELLCRHGLKLILACSDSAESLSHLVHYCQNYGITGLLTELKSVSAGKRSREETRLDRLEVEIDRIQAEIKGLDCFLHLNISEKLDTTSLEAMLTKLPVYVNPSTHLVFSSSCGDAWERHEKSNPVWNACLQTPFKWKFPLIPIVDSGAVGLGGGLWPTSTASELARIMEFTALQPLGGAIVTCSSIPKFDSFFSDNLSNAGKILYGHSLCHFEESELKSENFRMIKRINRFCQGQEKGLGEQRELGELILMELAYLRKRASAVEASSIFEYCYRDLRRIVAHELQSRQQPLPKSYLFSEEGGGGFWTEVEGGKMPVGYLASPKIKKLKVPSKGGEGSEQQTFFGENELFMPE